MSICTPCYDAGQVPKCIEVLTVGGSSLPEGTELLIYWESVATGRTESIEGLVQSGSIISTEGVKFPTGTYINLWVTLAAAQFNEYETILIDATDYTCISFQPVKGQMETWNFNIEDAE